MRTSASGGSSQRGVNISISASLKVLLKVSPAVRSVATLQPDIDNVFAALSLITDARLR